MSSDAKVFGVVFGGMFLFIFGLIFLFGSFGTIDQGERGVHTRLGKVIGSKDAGLYIKFPIIDKVYKYNTKTQVISYERENPLSAASKDLQDVQIATVVNYRLDTANVQNIYGEYGTHEVFEERVIRPAVRDTVKAVASNYVAEELVTKRAEFTDLINSTLKERLADKYIFIERVNVTNFQFSESFSDAIELKVTAEQEALAEQNKLAKVEFQAQQLVVNAEAEAEAIRIQANAINSQGGADYVNLKAVEQWDGVLPTQMIPGGAVPFLNL